jgi:hypothetical protein
MATVPTYSQPPAVKHDSDRSDDEKVAHQDEETNATVPYTSDLPPDPDAHLSPEERTKIVSAIEFDAQHDGKLIVNQDRKLLWKLDYTLIPWVRRIYPAHKAKLTS